MYSESVRLGAVPSADQLGGLGLQQFSESGGDPQQTQEEREANDAFTAIIPLLSHLGSEAKEKSEGKPARYLVAKGLPTLPMKLVEKAWNLEYVDMEEFLPAPRSLCLAEQGKPVPSLQESLVGAFNHFQALQQQRKAHQHVLDVVMWTRCFTLCVAMMARRQADMVPNMVAYMHTVLRLHQKAPTCSAWREYDVQFRMEIAASEDRKWTGGDPWQYVCCLPGQSGTKDPFDLAEQATPGPLELDQSSPTGPLASPQWGGQTSAGKGKRPMDSSGGSSSSSTKLPAKKAKKAGTCRLFNRAPGGCPYGRECIFSHRCMNCGVLEDHGRLACPHPPKPQQELM